jgi:hypothetical protein
VTIPRLSRDIEKPFRDALGHAIRNEIDKMEEGLLRLTDEQIASCLSMCVHVTGYVSIDACKGRWPDREDLRQLGEIAPRSKNARAFGLKEEEAYAYVKRVVFGGERLDIVFSPPEHAATLSFVITGHLIVAFSGAYDHWWLYLDKIEEAWEVAQVTDLALLPALMFRARGPIAEEPPESPSRGTDAVSS